MPVFFLNMPFAIQNILPFLLCPAKFTLTLNNAVQTKPSYNLFAHQIFGASKETQPKHEKICEFKTVS
jgi:hypothetical protein